AHHVRLGSIRGQNSLVFQIPLPSDICRMVIFDQDFPLLHRKSVTAALPGSAIDDPRTCTGAPESKGTSIGRILQEPNQLLIIRQVPTHRVYPVADVEPWQREFFLMIP